MKPHHRDKRGTKNYTWVFALAITVCAIIAAFSFQYYRSLHTTIREESKGYLQEVARRIGSNVDRIIRDNYAVLYTMATSVEAQGEVTLETVRPMLQKQKEHWDYKNVLFVDDAGRAYDLNSDEVFVTFDAALRQDILAGRESMSTTQLINNQEYIIFSVPLHDVVLDGRNMVAFALCYDPAAFDQVLSMTSFDEQAYSQIITKTGTAVTRSSSPYAMQTGYNVFSSLESAKLDDGGSIGRLQEDIVADRADQLSFTLDGVSRYMVYIPLDSADWYLLTFVPVSVVNEKSDLLLQTTLVICGVIVVAFAALLAALALISRNNRYRLEQIAFVDDVTGGNTIQRFYEEAGELLSVVPGLSYALVYTNIEKFKVLNEQLGREKCDEMLRLFYSFVNASLTDRECMGRLMADNFCLLLQYNGERSMLERFKEWHANADRYLLENGLQSGMPLTEFGVYMVEDRSLPFPQMVDRAKLALREASTAVGTRLHYSFYNDELRRQLFREKQLEDRMEAALERGEFQVYLQPKYRLPQERIGGAEALVRWVSAEEGMIFPNEFIPLFEKNGFIVQLDLYVFEVVCRTIQAWLQRGLQPVKVSVNCSRVHFRTSTFLEAYTQIADCYGLDRSYIEIELTESVVFDNDEQLLHIIGTIREAGFGCSMDDFGSGYSSLNLIQSIPVDTIKLDKIFFRSNPVLPQRTEAVVRNIVSMAKSLSMETVAEGVEHREQVEMLKDAGCDYIQGYVFAKPMQIGSFEELAFGKDKG